MSDARLFGAVGDSVLSFDVLRGHQLTQASLVLSKLGIPVISLIPCQYSVISADIIVCVLCLDKLLSERVDRYSDNEEDSGQRNKFSARCNQQRENGCSEAG